jgi:Holliday junction resolvase-like predicted endonuclease
MDGQDAAPAIRTLRRARGDAAEALVADRLRDAGWLILGQGVRVGRDEIDLVAVEPAGGTSQATLVVVEVRSTRSRRFGAPEESVLRGKLHRTWRAGLALVAGRRLPDGHVLPRLPWRVDLVTVEGDPAGEGAACPRLHHLRAVVPD